MGQNNSCCDSSPALQQPRTLPSKAKSKPLFFILEHVLKMQINQRFHQRVKSSQAKKMSSTQSQRTIEQIAKQHLSQSEKKKLAIIMQEGNIFKDISLNLEGIPQNIIVKRIHSVDVLESYANYTTKNDKFFNSKQKGLYFNVNYYLACALMVINSKFIEFVQHFKVGETNQFGLNFVRISAFGQPTTFFLDDFIYYEDKSPFYINPSGGLYVTFLQKLMNKLAGNAISQSEFIAHQIYEQLTGASTQYISLESGFDQLQSLNQRVGVLLLARRSRYFQEGQIFLFKGSRISRADPSLKHYIVEPPYILTDKITPSVKNNKNKKDLYEIHRIEYHQYQTCQIITEKEFKEAFSALLVCHPPRAQLKLATVTCAESLAYFELTPKKICQASIKLMQYFKMYVKGSDYEYSPVSICMVAQDGSQLFKGDDLSEEGNKSTCFFNKGVTSRLDKSRYFIRVRIYWDSIKAINPDLVYKLVINSTEQVDLVKLSPTIGDVKFVNALTYYLSNSEEKSFLNQAMLLYRVTWIRSLGCLFIKNQKKLANNFGVHILDCVNLMQNGASVKNATFKTGLQRNKSLTILFEKEDVRLKGSIGQVVFQMQVNTFK